MRIIKGDIGMEEFDEDYELAEIERKKTQIAKRENAVTDNEIVGALLDNTAAMQLAKEQHEQLKTQKTIAQKIGEVINKKTTADIETADLKVEQQRLANKVERARQKNELLKCKQERILLQKENRHALEMQKFRHRKEKYGDLLLRHCRKKMKDENGKWVFVKDKDGNDIVNMPNTFVLFWLIIFDSIVMFFNQIAEVIGSMNKIVRKAIWITLILLFVLVEPLRNWLFNLIGIHI